MLIPNGFERVGNRISTIKNNVFVNGNQKDFTKKGIITFATMGTSETKRLVEEASRLSALESI